MKNKMLFAFLITIIVVSCTKSPFKSMEFDQPTSSLTSFSFNKEAVEIDRLVLHYIKTNLDGSMPSEISVYYPADNKSESFKIYPWSKDRKEVYLIAADYDLDNFSLKKLTGNYVKADGVLEEYAGMLFENGKKYKTVISGKESPEQSVGHVPSFNYNFDLTDLNTMLRYTDKDVQNIDIGIIGFTGSKFVYSGTVQLTVNDSKSNSEYTYFDVAGEAFGDESGTIIIDAEIGCIRELSLPYPTTPPYKSYHLELQSSGHMTPEEWKEFITKKANEILGE